MTVVVNVTKTSTVVVESEGSPDLSQAVNAQIQGVPELGNTVGEAIKKLAENAKLTDGLVNGHDFLTFYRLERDN